MNERGLRVRFIQWSESATSTQQDRLRKCSLTIVAARKALVRTTQHAGKHHHRQQPESPGQKRHTPGIDGKSPKELLALKRDVIIFELSLGLGRQLIRMLKQFVYALLRDGIAKIIVAIIFIGLNGFFDEIEALKLYRRNA